jgi:hypothetical protein
MAIGNQIKALLKSHVDGDEAMFLSVAMQMAAEEAKKVMALLPKKFATWLIAPKLTPVLNRKLPR